MLDYPMKNVERQAISHVGMTTSYFKNSWGLLSLLKQVASISWRTWPPFGNHFLAQVRQRPSLTLNSLKASAKSWRAKKVICMIAYVAASRGD
jgi:hypothetical protein